MRSCCLMSLIKLHEFWVPPKNAENIRIKISSYFPCRFRPNYFPVTRPDWHLHYASPAQPSWHTPTWQIELDPTLSSSISWWSSSVFSPAPLFHVVCSVFCRGYKSVNHFVEINQNHRLALYFDHCFTVISKTTKLQSLLKSNPRRH